MNDINTDELLNIQHNQLSLRAGSLKDLVRLLIQYYNLLF